MTDEEFFKLPELTKVMEVGDIIIQRWVPPKGHNLKTVFSFWLVMNNPNPERFDLILLARSDDYYSKKDTGLVPGHCVSYKREAFAIAYKNYANDLRRVF